MRLSWLFDQRLAASAFIYREDLEHIEALGITGVVSLTIRNPIPEAPQETFHHLHIPVRDMTCPPSDALSRAVRFISREIDGGGRVLVHCGAGMGRTGTVLACFLVSRGRSADAAIREVREARPGSVETHDQEQGVLEFERRVREAHG